MSADNGRCEFECCDYCCPPKYMIDAGFKCPKELPIQPGDITGKCGATDADLMTEKEYDQLILVELEKRENQDKHEKKW